MEPGGVCLLRNGAFRPAGSSDGIHDEPQKEWARSIPGWIYFVYVVAVSTGVAGSIGLLLRKGWTTLMFAICLVAVIVQMFYTMIISGGLKAIGPSGLIMPSLVIAIAAHPPSYRNSKAERVIQLFLV